LTNAALADTKWLVLRNHAKARIKAVDFSNKTELCYKSTSKKSGGLLQIRLDKEDGPLLCSIKIDSTKGWKINTVALPLTQGAHDLFFSFTNPSLTKPDENGIQFDWFFFTNPFPGKGLKGYDSASKFYNDLMQPQYATKTPVMMDNPKELFRPTHIFERGNWLVKGKQVEPAVPKALGAMPAGAPANRLGMAMWMTDPKNPLVSRTIVNRIWEQFFGTGIAETLEDMGTQGIPPTHRELLDYLSFRLMHEYHWDLKKLMKEMVMSATYRQDSRLNKDAISKDPYNKFYARAPRVRLSAEQIRDQALVVSGLMSEKCLVRV